MSKKSITVVIVGNVDSGKSSITDHLERMCGPKSPLGRVHNENENNNNNNSLAHKEREIRGTYYVSCIISSNIYSIAIVDTPGQSKYTKNMIAGVSIADFGVVVISAMNGEYEAGKERVEELIMILYFSGVRQVIIVINKMDDIDINWSEERYNLIVEETRSILQKIGYNIKKVSFIPISAWSGGNIIESKPYLSWFAGPTLLSSFDLLSPPLFSSLIDQPLRISVSRIITLCGIGTIIMGKVRSGKMNEATQLYLSPSLSSHAITIQKHQEYISSAFPGDLVGLFISHIHKRHYWKGMLLGGNESPPRVCESFLVQLVVVSPLPKIIRAGYSPVIFCHSTSVTCTFAELLQTREKRTGKVIEEKPERIKKGDCALVKMIPFKPLSLEVFSYFPSLGKIIVYDSRVVATGVVVEVNYKKN